MSHRARIIVLGSAAGGGSPQWNCNCPICRRVRRGDPHAPRRTQTSLAVSADGRRWVLVNASPDLGEQLLSTSALHPCTDGRHSPIEAVVLTGAEIDQVTGLLNLRESEPFALYASRSTHCTLEESPIFDALSRDVVPRRNLAMNEPNCLADGDGQPLGIFVEPFAVPGKIPLYKEVPGQAPEIGEKTEGNIALQISAGNERFFFVPCIADITAEFLDRIDGASLVFFDGTLWRDDELIAAGLGKKSGRRMGHVSIDGPDGAMEALSGVDIGRKIFIHINNSNPVLLADSPQRRAVEEAGWEVAHDGMAFELATT